jgi:Na+-driven multidrug efflux pump
MRSEVKTGRIANVRRNIIYGFLQIGVSQVFPFIVRTVLIYRLGVEYLGLNSLFSSILSVLSLMELGFGTAVVYSLYKPVAEGDVSQISAYLKYYRKIYRFVGLAILAVGLLVMPFLNVLVKDLSLPGGLNLYVCYLIFLSNTV